MLPAESHPGFSAAPTFGNAPNTTGGTGAANSTPPYAANATQTLYLRVPGENAVADGPDDTTVDVAVEIPGGWTGPTYGAALENVNDVSTDSTNQPGDTATGRTCSVGTANGHQVLHWSLTGQRLPTEARSRSASTPPARPVRSRRTSKCGSTGSATAIPPKV